MVCGNSIQNFSFFSLNKKSKPHGFAGLETFLSVSELGLVDGQELAVADVTTPQTMLFKLHFTT